ncbi:MAG TPA: class I SAM-dependent methyltransferase [Acidimicrobiales bacterium]|nr:class I SAM-dependent methyltransferase [Acidimicrobiales bacterium]
MAGDRGGVVRKVAAPLSAYFDARFQELRQHIAGEDGLRAHLDRRLDSLEHRVGWIEDRIDERAGDLGQRMAQLETRVTVDTQTATELAAGTHRPHPGAGGAGRDGGGDIDTAMRSLIGTGVGDLGPGAADLLNWAVGHTGPSGQAGVWFNPPVTVEHRAGSVRPNEVNERIVEIPYALGAVAHLAPGSRVLDVGAAESTLALSLASLGLDVIAADLRPYPFEHPRLQAVVGPIEEWSGPGDPLDAVLCVSSLEHFGLGAYGEPAAGMDLDRRVLEVFAGWLRPGGELVLTAPYGAWSVDELQRVYDGAHLDALLEGWRVLDRQVCVRTAADRWERAAGEPAPSTWEAGRRGVVLLRATPAG